MVASLPSVIGREPSEGDYQVSVFWPSKQAWLQSMTNANICVEVQGDWNIPYKQGGIFVS